MKFYAKVRFKHNENAKNLINNFFAEFNPESSIDTKGENVEMEVSFNGNPPMDIIKAIKDYEYLEFHFGKKFDETYKEKEVEEIVEETKSESEVEEIVEETKSESEVEEIAEATKPETEVEEIIEKNPKKSQKTKKVCIKKIDDILQLKLKEIAEKADSYENFSKLVAEWLDMGQRTEFFVNLAIATTEVDVICWKELENFLKERGQYNGYHRVQVGRQVSEKLKIANESITILPFLSAMASYKDYSFGSKQIKEPISMELEGSEIVINVASKTSKAEETKKRVKMDCMPEIPHFEETLGSIDKNQPIEDRVKYVLSEMGWDQKEQKEKKETFEIINTAVRMEKISFDSILLTLNIPMEDKKMVIMICSKFINDFVSLYSSKKVKVLDFIMDLQKIIMNEGEIAHFSD